jgi:hypothetical protein
MEVFHRSQIAGFFICCFVWPDPKKPPIAVAAASLLTQTCEIQPQI